MSTFVVNAAKKTARKKVSSVKTNVPAIQASEAFRKVLFGFKSVFESRICARTVGSVKISRAVIIYYLL